MILCFMVLFFGKLEPADCTLAQVTSEKGVEED